MAFNAARANDALDVAVATVKGTFTSAGMTPLAVVINVVYGDQGHQWAVGSKPPDLPADVKHLLAASLTESSNEVRESDDHSTL